MGSVTHQAINEISLEMNRVQQIKKIIEELLACTKSSSSIDFLNKIMDDMEKGKMPMMLEINPIGVSPLIDQIDLLNDKSSKEEKINYAVYQSKYSNQSLLIYKEEDREKIENCKDNVILLNQSGHRMDLEQLANKKQSGSLTCIKGLDKREAFLLQKYINQYNIEYSFVENKKNHKIDLYYFGNGREGISNTKNIKECLMKTKWDLKGSMGEKEKSLLDIKIKNQIEINKLLKNKERFIVVNAKTANLGCLDYLEIKGNEFSLRFNEHTIVNEEKPAYQLDKKEANKISQYDVKLKKEILRMGDNIVILKDSEIPNSLNNRTLFEEINKKRKDNMIRENELKKLREKERQIRHLIEEKLSFENFEDVEILNNVYNGDVTLGEYILNEDLNEENIEEVKTFIKELEEDENQRLEFITKIKEICEEISTLEIDNTNVKEIHKGIEPTINWAIELNEKEKEEKLKESRERARLKLESRNNMIRQ